MTKRLEMEFHVTGTEYSYGRAFAETHSLAAVRRGTGIEIEGTLNVRGVHLDPRKRVRATFILEELPE